MKNEMKYVKLEEVSDIIMGQSPNSEYYNEEGLGYPFLQGCANFTSKYPVAEVYCKIPSKIAPKDAILISVRAPVGDINLSDREYCIGRGLAAIVPTNIDLYYLFYSIDLNKRNFRRVSQGSTFDAINSQDLRQFKILVPLDNRKEKRISDILVTLDNVIETTKKLINKYKKVKQGLMQDLFTRGVLPDGRLRPSFKEEPQIYKCTDLGYVPKEWNVKTLGQVCNIVSGGTPDRACPEYWEGGTIPWATPTDITGNNGRVINKTKEYITKKGLRNSSAKIVPPGSLLMTSRATIGEIKINEVEMCTNQGFKTLVPYEEIDSWFLYYQMRFFKQKYEALGSGSTFLEVSKKDTDKFAILVPNKIEEQRQIRDVLLNIDSAIEKNEQMIMKFNEIKLGLMQDLLTGKVRVKVEGDRDE